MSTLFIEFAVMAACSAPAAVLGTQHWTSSMFTYQDMSRFAQSSAPSVFFRRNWAHWEARACEDRKFLAELAVSSLLHSLFKPKSYNEMSS